MDNLITVKQAYHTNYEGYKCIVDMISDDYGKYNWSDMSYCEIRETIETELQKSVESWDFDTTLMLFDSDDKAVFVNGYFLKVTFDNGNVEYFADELYQKVKEISDYHETTEYRLWFLNELGYMWDTEKNELVNVM